MFVSKTLHMRECKGTITVNEGRKYFYDQKAIKSFTDIAFNAAHA